MRKLGRQQLPNLYRFMRAGASTMNARTEHEMTVTLPNHTGMVTGRRIEAATGGHGVTWNDDRPTPATVQAAAGHDVESVFTAVDDAGGSTALLRHARPSSASGSARGPTPSTAPRSTWTTRRSSTSSVADLARRPRLPLPAPVAARRRRARQRLDVEALPARGAPGRPPRRPRGEGGQRRPAPAAPAPPSCSPATTAVTVASHTNAAPARRLPDRLHGARLRGRPRRRPLRDQPRPTTTRAPAARSTA